MTSGRRFELRRELGSGSFGQVFLADMVSLGDFRKTVALKVLRPQFGCSSDAAKRLRDEARVLGRLRHRHIVAVDDLIRVDGRWAVVMEYVPGLDLEQLLKGLASPEGSDGDEAEQPAVPLGVATEIALAVAQALRSAYADAPEGGAPLRLVHRDIKPSNIRLSHQGEVKVLDFGIARADFDGREAQTDRVRYGSLPYMSPERLLGDPETTAADIYALASVYYELVVGSGLGRADLSPAGFAQAHAEAMEVLATRLPAGSREPIVTLLDGCLAYEPDERPDAATVIAALRDIRFDLGGESLEAYAHRLVPAGGHAPESDANWQPRVLTEETASGSGPAVTGDLLGAPGASTTLPITAASTFPTSLPAGVSGTPTLAEPVAPAQGPSKMAIGIPLLLAMGIGAAVAVGLGLVVMWGTGLLDPAPAETEAAEVDAPPEEEDGVEALGAEGEQTETTAETDHPGEGEEATETTAVAEATTTTEAGGAEAAEQAEAPAGTGEAEAPEGTDETVEGGSEAEASPSTTPATPATSTDPDAPRLRAVKFAVVDAAEVTATCGDVTATGASSALLRNVPEGSCRVRSLVDGRSYSTRVTVDTPRGYECRVIKGRLRCS